LLTLNFGFYHFLLFIFSITITFFTFVGFFFFFFLFLAVLGFELRALSLLGRKLYHMNHTQPSNSFFFFSVGTGVST
jgi:hypothetical protein